MSASSAVANAGRDEERAKLEAALGEKRELERRNRDLAGVLSREQDDKRLLEGPHRRCRRAY